MRHDPAADDLLLHLNRATLASQLVRGAAHELNNLLLTIQGSAELLAARQDLPDTCRPRLDTIGRQTARATAILQSVSRFARPPATEAPSTALAAAVDRVVSLRQFELRRAGIETAVDVPAAARVAVPAGELDHMLLNLLLNAERGAEGAPGPRIELRASETAGDIELRVTDNGRGWPADADQDALFDPFVTEWTEGMAAGLGLAVTRLLAGRRGGDLRRIPAERGAAIALRLPAAP